MLFPARGTPGVLTEVTLPAGGSGLQLSVRPTAAMYLTYTGTDGAPVGAAVRLQMAPNQWTALDQVNVRFFIGADSPSVGLVLAAAVR